MTVGYWCEYAWLGGPEPAAGVLIEVDGDRFTRVGVGTPRPAGARELPGLTVPGFADVHCHAFHRALRGRVQSGAGSFWAWRERMYRVAAALTPDGYRELATAVYAELALSGVTRVGEFHYLHHRSDGAGYPDPNAMGDALLDAAGRAGIGITLLDTCYLAGGIGEPLTGVQARFGDGDAAGWAHRATALHDACRDRPGVRIGAAVHSVRAVPADQLGTVVAWAAERDAPLHVHLSEQPAENEACLAAYGVTPTRLLAEHGALGARTVAVHATHLTDADIALLGGSGTGVCLCPTTERDLADGIGPAAELAAAGCPLSLGSDAGVRADLLEEARAVELNERLRTGRRGHFDTGALLTAATSAGHGALGVSDAGVIATGAIADLVTIDLHTPALAGVPAADAATAAVHAAGPGDIGHVLSAGRPIVVDGTHTDIDVPAALARAMPE